jgi:hypothetical protein
VYVRDGRPGEVGLADGLGDLPGLRRQPRVVRLGCDRPGGSHRNNDAHGGSGRHRAPRRRTGGSDVDQLAGGPPE